VKVKLFFARESSEYMQSHSACDVQPISCHVITLSRQQPEEELNKNLLPMNVSMEAETSRYPPLILSPVKSANI